MKEIVRFKVSQLKREELLDTAALMLLLVENHLGMKVTRENFGGFEAKDGVLVIDGSGLFGEKLKDMLIVQFRTKPYPGFLYR